MYVCVCVFGTHCVHIVCVCVLVWLRFDLDCQYTTHMHTCTYERTCAHTHTCTHTHTHTNTHTHTHTHAHTH